MKKFLAVYVASVSASEKAATPISKDEQAKGMQAWGKWASDNQSFIADQGSPLGKTKRVSREGIEDSENSLTGFVIVEAETHEAAAAIFKDHPHFSVFPGDSVEIMECLSLPQ